MKEKEKERKRKRRKKNKKNTSIELYTVTPLGATFLSKSRVTRKISATKARRSEIFQLAARGATSEDAAAGGVEVEEGVVENRGKALDAGTSLFNTWGEIYNHKCKHTANSQQKN